jgi:glycosyl transferase family 25
MIFDDFDMIRIINLPERTDRRRRMMRELRRVGLADDPRVGFFPAIRPADAGPYSSVGAHGVYLSHHAILKEAAAKNASVLILEDDCDFVPGIATYQAPERWDIFYGGYYAAQPDRLYESDIIGAHMMGFSAVAARQVADYLTALPPDGEHPPIDGAYVWFRRAHPEVKTVFATPTIGNQRPSRTDIGDLAFYDRLPIVRESVELARRVRNLFRGRDSRHIGELKW